MERKSKEGNYVKEIQKETRMGKARSKGGGEERDYG